MQVAPLCCGPFYKDSIQVKLHKVFQTAWFQTTVIKQISQRNESHKFFGFLEHIKIVSEGGVKMAEE